MGELFGVPDWNYLAQVFSRLVMAALLGGFIGFERQWSGKAAGLRTHMTVALGCATFMLVTLETSDDPDNVSRAIQGIAAGIGFIGAGTILKREHEADILGLTTAASIWLTAAVGTAVGGGRGWIALIGTVIAFVILTFFESFERWLERKRG